MHPERSAQPRPATLLDEDCWLRTEHQAAPRSQYPPGRRERGTSRRQRRMKKAVTVDTDAQLHRGSAKAGAGGAEEAGGPGHRSAVPSATCRSGPAAYGRGAGTGGRTSRRRQIRVFTAGSSGRGLSASTGGGRRVDLGGHRQAQAVERRRRACIHSWRRRAFSSVLEQRWRRTLAAGVKPTRRTGTEDGPGSSRQNWRMISYGTSRTERFAQRRPPPADQSFGPGTSASSD